MARKERQFSIGLFMAALLLLFGLVHPVKTAAAEETNTQPGTAAPAAAAQPGTATPAQTEPAPVVKKKKVNPRANKWKKKNG